MKIGETKVTDLGEEWALYDAKAEQVLTPDCRAWLEQGRQALKIG